MKKKLEIEIDIPDYIEYLKEKGKVGFDDILLRSKFVKKKQTILFSFEHEELLLAETQSPHQKLLSKNLLKYLKEHKLTLLSHYLIYGVKGALEEHVNPPRKFLNHEDAEKKITVKDLLMLPQYAFIMTRNVGKKSLHELVIELRLDGINNEYPFMTTEYK